MIDRPRILFVVNSLGFGGAERQTVSLIRSMDRSAFDIHLAVLQERPREMTEAAHLAPVGVWRGRFRRGLDIGGIRRFATFLRAHRPDVMVCVNTFPLLIGTAAKLLGSCRAKTITVFHTTELGKSRARRHTLLYRWLMNRSARVVYVCDAQKQYWTQRGLRRDNATVIHNGIDSGYLEFDADAASREAVRRSIGIDDGDIAVGICAGLRPEKAHDDLIRAIARLREAGKPYKAVIIGDGPCRDALTRQIAESKLDDAVMMLGTKDDVRPYVHACDIMVLVSHAVETFSLAALESMALRRPLVLSNIGGAAEQVKDGVNGYLFPKGDIDALVARLSALEDPADRARMGEDGRRILEERFLRETMTRKYEQLIGTIAATPEQPAYR